VIPLQNVQTVIFLVNLHGTPKQWAIAHKMALKRKNDKFFCHASQTCIECHGLVNQSRTPKLWAIAHENGSKMQTRRVFWHPSKKCTECHGPCKSPWNPKTVGNSS
jgi:DnaJ-class molecular chaperone